MSDQNKKLSRRQMLRGVVGGFAAAQVSAWGTRPVYANELLNPDDPMAQALAYYEDATQVDKSQQSTYKNGQTCGNCLQYQSSDDGGQGTCALFPGKLVAGAGWCKVWARK